MKTVKAVVLAAVLAVLSGCVTGCAALEHKGVDAGFQATSLVAEGTPGDPATGSGPSGKLIYGDTGSFFHDAPAKPHSIWIYHWISYAWLPALWGNNQLSTEVTVMTYGGDGDAATDAETRGIVYKMLGVVLTPQVQTVIKTTTPSGSTTVVTDQSGNTAVTKEVSK